MSQVAGKQMNSREVQIKNLQEALQAVRSLDESGQGQAAALEKHILGDLRQVREMMESNELKWV